MTTIIFAKKFSVSENYKEKNSQNCCAFNPVVTLLLNLRRSYGSNFVSNSSNDKLLKLVVFVVSLFSCVEE